MCPTVPLDPQVLEGGLFSSHLAAVADKDKFDMLMSSTTSIPGGVHVNLHHALGPEVLVELFHACLIDLVNDFTFSGVWGPGPL